MLERETLVDVTLISAEGKSMKVHRLMLCASSKLFEDKFIQRPSVGPITINLKDIWMEDLQSVIEFIYKGEISVALAQVPSLLKAASSLKITGLMYQILEFDLHQFQSLATPAAKSADMTNNTEMTYDAESKQSEKQDHLLDDNEIEEQLKTEETGMNQKEMTEQSDDGQGQLLDFDSNEYLSQHSSLDGVDSSNDSSDEVLGRISTAGPNFQSHCSAFTEISPKVISQLKKTGMVHSNSGGPEKPYKCSKCGRTYSRMKTMRRHFLNECDTEPRFRCSQCDYRTHWKHSLQAHLIRFHEVDRSQLAAFGAGPSSKFTMPFKCDKCQSAFKYKHNLDLHTMNECKDAKH